MSESNWFLSRNGQQFGPYSWEQLVQMARSGHVEAHDIVWRQGDAGSHPASEVPGLMPAKAASSRGLMIGLAAGVAALAVALVVVLVSRNGGDKAASDTDSSDTTEEVTTAPRKTTTTVKETTSAAPTTVETTTSTTVKPTTTPPPTEPPTTAPVVASEADLLAALPPTDALPMGWAVDDGTPTTDLKPLDGLVSGTCGLMNNDRRAVEAGAVAHADDPQMYLPDNGFFDVSLYSFPATTDVSAFLAITDQQATTCVEGIEYDLIEGDGVDEVDIFSDASNDGIVWHVQEWETPMPLPSLSADERYAYGYVTVFTTVHGGLTYTATFGEIDLYERYGSVVVVAELYGSWDIGGFSSWNEPNYQPTIEVVESALAEVRDGIVSTLRDRGVIS